MAETKMFHYGFSTTANTSLVTNYGTNAHSPGGLKQHALDNTFHNTTDLNVDLDLFEEATYGTPEGIERRPQLGPNSRVRVQMVKVSVIYSPCVVNRAFINGSGNMQGYSMDPRTHGTGRLLAYTDENGIINNLVSITDEADSVNDYLDLRCVGTTIEGGLNQDWTEASITDTRYSSGYPGIWGFRVDATGGFGDAFQGFNIDLTVPPTEADRRRRSMIAAQRRGSKKKRAFISLSER